MDGHEFDERLKIVAGSVDLDDNGKMFNLLYEKLLNEVKEDPHPVRRTRYLYRMKLLLMLQAEKLMQGWLRVTAHDMRRTFRAIAGECGLELWKAKLLMNHRLNQDVTIGHYTETEDLRYLSAEINLIGNWIIQKALVAGSDNVVTLPGRAGGEG